METGFDGELPPLDVTVLDPRRVEVSRPAPKEEEPPKDLLDFDIDELAMVKVVTPSRREESAHLAPNVTRIFTREDIRRGSYKTLKDLLVNIPGFGVFHRDLQFVSQVRGIAPNDNEKVTLMLNGQSLNQVTEPEWLVGPIHLGLVERVEVIMGPGSVLYGDESLTAIINLITLPPEGVEARVGFGTDGSLTGVANAGFIRSGTTFQVGASWMRRDGWDAWPAHSNPNLANSEVTGQLDPSTFLFFTASQEKWEVQYTSIQSEFPELSGFSVNPTDDGHRRYDNIDLFRLRHHHDLPHDLEGTFTGEYQRKRMVRDTVAAPIIQAQTHDLFQTGFNLEYHVRGEKGGHLLQGGIQYGHRQNRHNLNYSFAPDDPSVAGTITSLGIVENTQKVGIFLEDTWTISPEFKLILAGRIDHNTLVDSNDIYTAPRAALVWTPEPNWTHKLMFNQANRSPSPWASRLNPSWRRDQNPAYFVNDPADRPEELMAFEWQSIYFMQSSRISLNLFHQRLDGFITWMRPFTNTGDFRGEGGELEIFHPIHPRVRLNAGLGYAENDFTITANSAAILLIPADPNGDVVGAPKWTAHLGIDVDIDDRFAARLDVQGFHDQPTFFTDKGVWGHTNGYATADLSLTGRQLLNNTDGSLRITNIFDNQHVVAGQFRREVYRPRGRVLELEFQTRF